MSSTTYHDTIENAHTEAVRNYPMKRPVVSAAGACIYKSGILYYRIEFYSKPFSDFNKLTCIVKNNTQRAKKYFEYVEEWIDMEDWAMSEEE